MRLALRSLLPRATAHADVSLAVLGCALAVPIMVYLLAVIRAPVYTLIGSITSLTCLAYLLLRRRRSPVKAVKSAVSRRVYLLLNILFFALLTYGIVAFHLRPELYTRPLGYFFAIAAMVGILAVEVVFLPARKSTLHFALLKIVAVGLSLAWSPLFLHPTVVGVDPWYHQMFVARLLDAGHVPSGFSYSWVPGMHLVVGATSLVTGLDYKMATMLSVSLFQVVCATLFIFLLGRFVHSTKAGLLAALLLVTSGYFIWIGYWTIPNGMAIVLIPIIIYLLFKPRQKKPRLSIGLALLFMAVVVITHTLATAMLALLLLLIWLGSALHRRLHYGAMEGSKLFLGFSVAFSGAGLGYWAAVSQLERLGEAARAVFVQWFGTILPGVSPPPVEPSPLQQAVAQYENLLVPVGEHLFNSLGFILFCALILIGGLAMLSQSMRNSYSFALITSGLAILAVNFLGILPFRSDIAVRFNCFLQVLLAIAVGLAILWIAGLPRHRIGGACLVGIMVFALSFVMILNPPANPDNTTLSPNTIVRYAFTDAEVHAVRTVSNYHDGEIGIDGGGIRPLQLVLAPGNEIVPICEQLVSQDYATSRNTLILIREEIVVNPMSIWRVGRYRLDHDPRPALTEQGFSRIYDSGAVSAFLG